MSMGNFYTRWIEISKKKKSLLCAGVDPRYNKHQKKKLFSFLKRYIDNVIPYVSAFKINLQFFRLDWEQKILNDLLKYIKSKDDEILLIADAKYQDIGKTNFEAMMRVHKDNIFDLATFCPFAGNLKEGVIQLDKFNVGTINLCLMSNPEYERQKNFLVEIKDEKIKKEHKIDLNGKSYMKKYIYDSYVSKKYGSCGIVVGSTNHISSTEIRDIDCYAKSLLFLVPGFGLAQKGTLDNFLSSKINLKKIIVNVSEGLMYPRDKNQRKTAKNIKNKINRSVKW